MSEIPTLLNLTMGIHFFIFFFLDTSRPRKAGEENGKGYFFISRSEMQREIDDGKFVEWGEYEDHLYGTKIDSIRNVMRSGKMCILDLNPTVRFFNLKLYR